jgi:FkbM family methyltransferase
MMQAAIFEKFARVPVVTDGESIYDFLGVATAAHFRKGWSAHVRAAGKELLPVYPTLNEHYFDWILTLTSVDRADGIYRMAELGAGWGAWSVRAATAARQNKNISAVELLAIEADATHYGWMLEHFRKNGINPEQHHVLHGALAAAAGRVKFPVIDDPSDDYGASMKRVYGNVPYVEVNAYSIADLLDRFSGPLDFMHVDVQGAEYDTLPGAMGILRDKVKSIMVGTHFSAEHHAGLAAEFVRAGWVQVMNYPRGSKCETEFGAVTFGDGLISFSNPRFLALDGTAGEKARA